MSGPALFPWRPRQPGRGWGGKCLERVVFQVAERHPGPAKTAGYHVPTFPAAAPPPWSLAVVLCPLPKCGRRPSGRSIRPRQRPGYLSGTCNVQIQMRPWPRPQPTLLPLPGWGSKRPPATLVQDIPTSGLCASLTSAWDCPAGSCLSLMPWHKRPPDSCHPPPHRPPPEWKLPESRAGSPSRHSPAPSWRP